MMTWVMLHPHMTLDVLGFLPGMLSEEDPRPAREQFNERYAYGGGWRPFGQDKFKLKDNLVLTYPEDPPSVPLALLEFRNELIVFYEHAIVMIRQRDGSFEVSRMD